MKQISPKNQSFTVNYSDYTLPPVFIAQYQYQQASLTTSWLKEATADALYNLIDYGKQTLIIATDKLDKKFIVPLQQAIDKKGLRVYLCLGDSQANQQVIDKLQDRCQIRSGVRQQGSLWLADINSLNKRGIIDLVSHQVILNKQQFDDAYRSFCKIYWQEAKYEHIENKQQPAQKINQQIITNHSYQQTGTLTNSIVSHKANLFCHTAPIVNIPLNLVDNSKVLIAHNEAEQVYKMVNDGMEVALTNTQLPTVFASIELAWLLPSHANENQANWALELNQQQTNDINQILEKNLASAKWQLKHNKTIGQLVNKELIFANNISKKSIICEPIRNIILKDFYCSSIEQFLNSPPESLLEDQLGWQTNQLAEQIEYTVVIHPPYLPAKAKVDELIEAWQQADNQWQIEIKKLNNKIESLRNQQNELTKSPIKRFISHFVLGQKQELKTISQKLEVLNQIQPSKATPAERNLNKLELIDIATELAGFEKGIAQQKKLGQAELNWTNMHEQLTKTSNEKTAEWQSTKKVWNLKEPQLSADKLKLINDTNKELNDAYSKLDNKKGLPDSLSYEQIKGKISNNKAKKRWPTLNAILISTNQKIAAFEQKHQELQEKLKATEKAKNLANQKLEDHGDKFKLSITESDQLDKQLGLKPEKPLNLTWPNDELPQVGLELFSDQHKRYLVLNNSNLLKQAQSEAERLKAAICVKPVKTSEGD